MQKHRIIYTNTRIHVYTQTHIFLDDPSISSVVIELVLPTATALRLAA